MKVAVLCFKIQTNHEPQLCILSNVNFFLLKALLKNTVKPPLMTTSLGDQISKNGFPIKITIFGTSCKQPPLAGDYDHF